MTHFRPWVQAVSALLTNGHLRGFLSGSIYQGPLKHVCVPTLNCYSCPGALFACPIGSAQAILAGGGGLDLSAPHTFAERLRVLGASAPLFIIGFLTIIGALVGRASCGWVCPFGALQDLLHRLPVRKFKVSGVLRHLRYLRYVVLVVMVILLPLLLVDDSGYGAPYFCKFICPAGTLEGGWLLPLYPGNAGLRAQLGRLFAWKSLLLVVFLLLMTMFRRPFCAWLCPLGAFFAPFNKVSLFRLELSKETCINCGKCSRVCPCGLQVTEEIDSQDCVRCLECERVCPTKAIVFSAGSGGAAMTAEIPNSAGQPAKENDSAAPS